MTNSNVNSESSQDSRSLANAERSAVQTDWLEALWAMSEDVSPEVIKSACKEARERVFHAKSEDEAKSWRFVMDALFSMWVRRLA